MCQRFVATAAGVTVARITSGCSYTFPDKDRRARWWKLQSALAVRMEAAGPRDARTTSARDWGSVTSVSTSASERLAMATIARLAVISASMSSSRDAAFFDAVRGGMLRFLPSAATTARDMAACLRRAPIWQRAESRPFVVTSDIASR